MPDVVIVTRCVDCPMRFDDGLCPNLDTPDDDGCRVVVDAMDDVALRSAPLCGDGYEDHR